MGFLDKLLGRKKGPAPAVLFDSDVKKMDIRNGSFVWLLDNETKKEYCGNFGINKVIIDLSDEELAIKVHVKTVDGLVKIPLRDILENLGNRHGYFKFIHLDRALHVRIHGVPNGDVTMTFTEAKFKKGIGKAEEEPEEQVPEEKTTDMEEKA